MSFSINSSVCINNIIIIIISLIISSANAYPWLAPSARATAKIIKPLIKSNSRHYSKTLTETEIVKLAKLGNKSGGTKQIGQQLGKMRLPPDVLEDTYMRIAIQQSKISRQEAEAMYGRLHGVPGFQSTLSKIIGNSGAKTVGHLNELKIADQAAQKKFQVRGIGMPFFDVNKASPTDIDIVLKRRGKVFAVEAKDYLPTTPIPLDKFRADMVTLKEYARQNSGVHVIKVFTITHIPNDELTQKILLKEAQRHEVELIYGLPDELVLHLDALEKIL